MVIFNSYVSLPEGIPIFSGELLGQKLQLRDDHRFCNSMSFSFFLPLLLFLTIVINIITCVSLNYKSAYETPDHWHTSSRVSSIGKKKKPPTDSMHPRNKYTLLLVALQLGFSPAANDICTGSCRWFTTSWSLVWNLTQHQLHGFVNPIKTKTIDTSMKNLP